MLSNDQMNADAREAHYQQNQYNVTSDTIETVINKEYDTDRLRQMWTDVSANYVERVTNREYFMAHQDQRILQAIQARLFELR